MIIYKDIVTGDELFSDIFNPRPPSQDDDFVISVDAKMISRKTDEISDAVFGGNASKEEQAEHVEGAKDQMDLDIKLNHNLEDVSNFFQEKKEVTSYLKKYCKNLATKLGEGECEGDKEKLQKFKDGCTSKEKKLDKFVRDWWTPDVSVYVGEHLDYFAEEKACLLFGHWSEDQMSVKIYCLTAGLREEKQ